MELTMNTNTTDGKRNAAITATIDDNLGGLTLTFANGQELRIHASQLTATIGAHALMHGLKQKLVDAAAISRNPETGRPATVQDKFEAVKVVYDRLLSGAWNATREGGAPTGGLLLQALCRMYTGRKTVEELKTFLADKTDAEKAALRKNPRIAQHIADIRAEQAKDGGIDADDLLAGLDGDDALM
jgi:hypothetical protein